MLSSEHMLRSLNVYFKTQRFKI